MNKDKQKPEILQPYISAGNLLKKQFEEDKFFIENLIPVGSLCLLSSRPKAGKTNLALQMATAIASGKFFLSFKTKKAKVLFISLELNQKQMKKRLERVLSHYEITDANFKKFPLALRFSSEKKGIEALSEELEYLRKVYRLTFDVIFIDTYVLFKDIEQEAVKKHKSVYELESEYLAKLRKFCEETNTTIVLIYHNRKSQMLSGDITENIMGSTGIAGAVNEIFLLERKTGDDKAKLLTTGHTIEELEIELEFKDGLFTLLTGTQKELRIAEKIIEYLKQVKVATQTEIIRHLKAIGETNRVGDIHEVLNKFNGEYWESKTEKRKGRASVIYYLTESKPQHTEQMSISTISENDEELERYEELLDLNIDSDNIDIIDL